MAPKPDVFLDTSALFAGIWSASGGGRLLLKLGEAGVVQLRLSRQVLVELDRTVRHKAPAALPGLAILLERTGLQVVSDPPDPLVSQCQQLTGHPNDARVLAAAWAAQVGYFVTLDRQRVLDNPLLAATFGFTLGAPGDCLAWLRASWLAGDL